MDGQLHPAQAIVFLGPQPDFPAVHGFQHGFHGLLLFRAEFCAPPHHLKAKPRSGRHLGQIKLAAFVCCPANPVDAQTGPLLHRRPGVKAAVRNHQASFGLIAAKQCPSHFRAPAAGHPVPKASRQELP